MNTEQLLAAQRRFYNSGATIPVDFRISMLKKLYRCIKENEGRIAAALKADLGKCPYEAFMCETGLVLSEISYMIKHIRKYARPHRVHTPLAQFISKSCTTAVPYGNVLIMSPWNYPLLLTLDPLVNAIAAGNTAIVKPSAYSPASGALIRELISCCFDEEYIAVVMGGREENANLLSMKFAKVRGMLTDEEFALIKRHPQFGFDLIKDLQIDSRIKRTALMHHERCDSSGYPSQLDCALIDDFAMITAIADVYDAMTAARRYRAPLCPFAVISSFESEGFTKYNTKFLLLFLKKLATTYQNNRVMLNDSRFCNIVMLNPHELSRPIVRFDDGSILDLSTNREFFIKSVM